MMVRYHSHTDIYLVKHVPMVTPKLVVNYLVEHDNVIETFVNPQYVDCKFWNNFIVLIKLKVIKTLKQYV